MSEFKNKTVVITGAIGDIGAAMASLFLEQGSQVCISDIFAIEEAHKQQPELLKHPHLHYTRVDVRDYAAVSSWLEDCKLRYGSIDICVANASKVTVKDLTSISAAEWMDEINVNLNGSFHVANSCAKLFQENQIAGSIVFIGSWAAHAVHSNLPAYTVSKAAVRMLCQTMALTYAPFGIRVNEIAPGFVNAGLSKQVWQKEPDAQEKAKGIVPLNGILESSEVAQQVLWVCSSANRLLTGASIVIDGGISLVRP